METPEVFVKVKKNGVFLHFPILYLREKFGVRLPDTVKLICGGKEVVAKLYTVYRDVAQYRVFTKYVPAVMDSDECVINT